MAKKTRKKTKSPKKRKKDKYLSFGQRLADRFASVVGSWRFILIQTTFLVAWIVANATMALFVWDPYPFILLNLFLSFQAAYTGPVIMMSQNRQAEIDRETMRKDYELSENAVKILEALVKHVNCLEENRAAQLKILEELLEEKGYEGDVKACPQEDAK